MEDPRARARGRVHGPARRNDRQRRGADDPRRSARRRGRARVDHRWLRARVRRRPDRGRPSGRHLRPQTAVHHRRARICRLVDGLRGRGRLRDADRLPARPRRGGRPADPAGPGHHPRGIPALRARQGVRRVRPRYRCLGRARPDPRRRADRRQRIRERLAADLLHQPPAWPDRGVRGGAADGGGGGGWVQITRRTAAAPGPCRHRARGTRHGAARVPADPGPAGGLAGLDLPDGGRKRALVRAAGGVEPASDAASAATRSSRRASSRIAPTPRVWPQSSSSSPA